MAYDFDPILLPIEPFDATKDYFGRYTWNGQGTVSGIQVRIKDGLTFETVYDEYEETSAVGVYKIPAGTLQNGKNYSINISLTNSYAPAISGFYPFYCYSTPTFEFINITSGQQIDSNSYNFILNYNQAEGEQLNSLVMNLYSSTGILLATSGTMNGFYSVPMQISYLFSGFSDEGSYYVEATGTTLHGITLNTGTILFSVDYIAGSAYNNLLLRNNCAGGYIEIQSNVTVVEATAYPDPPTYIDDKEIDLTADGTFVNFDRGYQVNNDFTVKIWGRRFKYDDAILRLYPNADESTPWLDKERIELIYHIKDSNVYVELLVHDVDVAGYEYVAYSNEVHISSTDEQIYIMLRRINGIYQITIENRGVQQ